MRQQEGCRALVRRAPFPPAGPAGWTGADLSARLGVPTRTMCKDIDRLRELGYPVDATLGAAGGYRLGAGGKLPPLLLDDEEAVAVAVGLRWATGVAGIAESSARARSLPPQYATSIGSGSTTAARPGWVEP